MPKNTSANIANALSKPTPTLFTVSIRIGVPGMVRDLVTTVVTGVVTIVLRVTVLCPLVTVRDLDGARTVRVVVFVALIRRSIVIVDRDVTVRSPPGSRIVRVVRGPGTFTVSIRPLGGKVIVLVPPPTVIVRPGRRAVTVTGGNVTLTVIVGQMTGGMHASIFGSAPTMGAAATASCWLRAVTIPTPSTTISTKTNADTIILSLICLLYIRRSHNR